MNADREGLSLYIVHAARYVVPRERVPTGLQETLQGEPTENRRAACRRRRVQPISQYSCLRQAPCSTPAPEVLVSSGVREANGLRCLANSLIVTSGPSGVPHDATGTAGFPCTAVIGGTDRVTTLPAVTTAPRPTTTPGRMMAPGPTKASRSIVTPLNSLKWAMTVTRMPIELPSSTVIRYGREVSRMTRSEERRAGQ